MFFLLEGLCETVLSSCFFRFFKRDNGIEREQKIDTSLLAYTKAEKSNNHRHSLIFHSVCTSSFPVFAVHSLSSLFWLQAKFDEGHLYFSSCFGYVHASIPHVDP